MSSMRECKTKCLLLEADCLAYSMKENECYTYSKVEKGAYNTDYKSIIYHKAVGYLPYYS